MVEASPPLSIFMAWSMSWPRPPAPTKPMTTEARKAHSPLLAAVLGLLLALPRWRAPWSLVLNVLRSVPELVWATITALTALPDRRSA